MAYERRDPAAPGVQTDPASADRFVAVWLRLLATSPRWALAGLTPAFRVRLATEGGISHLRDRLLCAGMAWSMTTAPRVHALDEERVVLVPTGAEGPCLAQRVHLRHDAAGWAVDDVRTVVCSVEG